MNVFIDTSAFLALLSRTDEHHENAERRWKAFMTDGTTRLFTSNYIVVETCALLRNRLGMSAVTDFTQALLTVTTILWVDQPTHFAAVEAMLTAGTNGPSLTDCSSFALMHEKGITSAFAYDKHYRKYRF